MYSLQQNLHAENSPAHFKIFILEKHCVEVGVDTVPLVLGKRAQKGAFCSATTR